MRRAALLLVLVCSCQQGSRPLSEPKRGSIDAILGPRQNLGAAGVALGPVGDRLWCDGLAPALGMRGTFQYIHPGLHASMFELDIWEAGRPLILPPMGHRWYPSHTAMETAAAALRIQETKFITRDDLAVDAVQVRNDSPEARRLTLRLRSPLLVQPVEGGLAGVDRQFGVSFGFAVSAGGFAAARERASVHAAMNAARRGPPEPRASFTYASDSAWAAVDGTHAPGRRWTSVSSGNASDWFEVDFGAPREVDRVVLDLVDDGDGARPPKAVRVEIEKDGALSEAPGQVRSPEQPAGGLNMISMERITTRRLRVTFEHQPGKASGLLELEVYPEREIERPVLEREFALTPYGQASFVAVAAFADDAEKARAIAGRTAGEDAARVVKRHAEEYAAWFDQNVPRFECPDPWFERLWWHRWQVVRRCLADPKAGFLREPCFFRGRHDARAARVSPIAHALQCADARWLRDPRYAYGHVSAVLRNQFEGREGFFPGMFPGVQVEQRLDFYAADWIPRGVWDVAIVHPDRAYLEWALPRLEKNLEGVLARFDPDKDYLPAVLPQVPGDAHTHSGMDWSPAFFWFGQPRSFGREEALERVEFACALYAGCRAIAEIRGVLGRERGEYDQTADRIAQAVAEKMWDKERKFFYALRPDTDEKALVEEVAGFYPYAFDLPLRDMSLERLFDPAQFWCAIPARSASRRIDTALAAGPRGARWNGPAWLSANSLVAEAVAVGIRRRPDTGVTRRDYFDFMQRTVRAQYEDGDLSRPVVGEFCDGDSGAWPSAARDVFDSTYADLLIRHVGGLVPRVDDVLEFFPIVDAWDRFRFEGIPYRGRRLDIEWRRGEGLTVRDNGSVLFVWPRLEHIVYDRAKQRATKAE